MVDSPESGQAQDTTGSGEATMQNMFIKMTHIQQYL